MELNSLPSTTTVESNDSLVEFNSTNGARKIPASSFFNSKLGYSSKTVSGSNSPVVVDTTAQPNANVSKATMTKVNRLRTLTLVIGGLSLAAGKNTIAHLVSYDDRPAAATSVYAVGTVGADTAVGKLVRLELDTNSPSPAVIVVADEANTSGTLRVTVTYIAATD